MRRKERQLSGEDAARLLENGEYGVLATFGEDGWPYGVPVSYAYDGSRIYFHGAKSGHKLDNLRYCARASFTVVGDTHVLQEIYSTAYQSVIAFGTVQAVEDRREKVEALVKLAEKYCYDNIERARPYAEKSLENVGVYRMDILRLTGKRRLER